MVNSHGNVVIPIPGEIMAVDTKGRVVSAKGVYDYNLVKDQETINSEVQANIQNLQNQIDAAGEGGTTNYSELINKPKINNIELEGNVTLEIPDSYTKEQSDALHNALQRSIEGKANASDVYTQQQINSKVKTLEDRISEIEDHSGATFDPTQYYTKTQSDEKYQGVGDYLTSSDIAGKVNTSDFNTYKNSSDTRFTNLERDKVSGASLSETLRNYALKSELPEGTTVDNFINGTSTNPVQNKIIYSALQNKQDALVSGTNIKALRSNNAQDQSLVGNGFINFKTINGNSIFGTEDIKVAAGEGGGENNIIENITVNGDPVPVSETKTAEITISVPTALSELSSDENHNTVSETQITGWNNKIGGNELKTINGQSILVNGSDTNLVVNPAKNTAGATAASYGSGEKLYYTGAKEQTVNPQTYTDSRFYSTSSGLYGNFDGVHFVKVNDDTTATSWAINVDDVFNTKIVNIVSPSTLGLYGKTILALASPTINVTKGSKIYLLDDSFSQIVAGNNNLQSVLDSKLTSSDIPDTADELTYISSDTHQPNNTRSGYTLQRVIEDFDRALDERQNTANRVTSISSSNTNTQYPSALAVYNALSTKQNTLVSGENIKTINGTSILGSGNITINSSSGQGIKM